MRLGQHPHAEQDDEHRRDERTEREARHRDAVRAGHVERPGLRRQVRSAPPFDRVTNVAPAARAPRAISSVSSVLPEYDTANASVRGPTNAGVR